jgi:hypothetical protein
VAFVWWAGGRARGEGGGVAGSRAQQLTLGRIASAVGRPGTSGPAGRVLTANNNPLTPRPSSELPVCGAQSRVGDNDLGTRTMISGTEISAGLSCTLRSRAA